MKKKASIRTVVNARDSAIAAKYDQQTDDEIAAEIDAAFDVADSVFIQVPRKLLPAIRTLIARQKKPA